MGNTQTDDRALTVTLDGPSPLTAEGQQNRNVTATVQENTTDSFYTVQYSQDADLGVTFSLLGTDADLFTINKQGELAFKTPANYESRPVGSRDEPYSLQIVCDGR